MGKTFKAIRVRCPSGLEGYTESLVEAALAEDVGSGDITTKSIVSSGQRASCVVVAKEAMVVAGLFVAERVFKAVDKKTALRARLKDGEKARRGDVVATVTGPLQGILTAERAALNFLQKLSGVATLTERYVRSIKGTGARILDTRKTTPCLRPLERYAVRMGGADNHRFGLFDAVLIKDNHIAAAGGIREAIEKVRKAHPDGIAIEVETSNLREVKEAVGAGADTVMLDNMEIARMKKAVKLIAGRAAVEASGGVTLDNVRDIARCGVDFISVGALTHSARAVDISLRVEG